LYIYFTYIFKKLNILTRKELAEVLGISRQTLNNWEKEKPELVRLINQGLALDEQIEETKKYLDKLLNIKEEAGKGKFNLK
jgi:transcriptional regulator with XRE-family HTH domain